MSAPGRAEGRQDARPVVEIERWRGVDPSTGQEDTPRFTITHEGRNLLTFGSEAECRARIRQHGWQLRESVL